MAKTIKISILGFLLISPVLLSAQTAGELEVILETQSISNAQALAFVLGSLDMKVPNAFDQALVYGWFPPGTAPEDPITLRSLSFLMMQAFVINGGLMYRLFPGPRYAYRTMLSRSFIQGAADPYMRVSGERFLLILGNVLNAAGGEE